MNKQNSNNLVKEAELHGVFVIDTPTFEDERGFFREIVRMNSLESAIGTSFRVAQANHARSRKGTLRGIHAAPWNKLIYVSSGNIQAVIVDLRQDSYSFGKYDSFVIGDEDRFGIFIPAGCGNSYLVLSDFADYIYLTDQEWKPGVEKGLAWNDPDLSISWLIKNPILSEKDKNNPKLQSLFPDKFKG